MNLLLVNFCIVFGGLSIGLGSWFLGRYLLNRTYQRVIDSYLNTQGVLEHHIRQHVLKEKDWHWAEGCSPLVTFGIKEDFSLMTTEELDEARKLAKRRHLEHG